ncbi:MAG: hypothetical protein KF861_09740, partial [Planctomycetaceae bacterium]|nr:hypothetical protein [Planctomycetaceae bacterium]
YGMAKCKTAHSIPPVENGSGSYCAWVNNQCVKTTGSQCVDRWGLAVAGKCWVESLSTDPTHSCYENAYHTFVNVKWYAAHCEGYNGSCACKWEPSTTTQPMQVCECYDARNPQ